MKSRIWLIFKVALFFVVIVVFINAFSNMSLVNEDESKKILEKSIDRAITNCYAIEGVYPPDFDYIEKNYNVHVDDSRYYVDYQVFASNVRPIVVIAQRGNMEAEGESIGE